MQQQHAAQRKQKYKKNYKIQIIVKLLNNKHNTLKL